ncbi:MAG: methylmalonyl-CoA mutase family protein, partial [candidate division KSB1 bacterium]
MKTDAGISLKPFYTSQDLPDTFNAAEQPGDYPYTRGLFAEMYRAKFWTMRQYGGYASAEESNARYRFLIAQGQTGLSVAFDLPTQMGYDSDHP